MTSASHSTSAFGSFPREVDNAVAHVNVTEQPTAQWTAQQIVDAFPWDDAPRDLLRDRDSVYRATWRQRVRNMGIEDSMTAPRSPWQNPYVERLIGSIRREGLDHVMILNEQHLKRVLQSYVDSYHAYRTRRAPEMDAPIPRPVQPPAVGPGWEVPAVGGLHHH
jgi:putative transposase